MVCRLVGLSIRHLEAPKTSFSKNLHNDGSNPLKISVFTLIISTTFGLPKLRGKNLIKSVLALFPNPVSLYTQNYVYVVGVPAWGVVLKIVHRDLQLLSTKHLH